MKWRERRPARPGSGNDIAAAWILVAVLLLLLGGLSLFDVNLLERVQIVLNEG